MSVEIIHNQMNLYSPLAALVKHLLDLPGPIFPCASLSDGDMTFPGQRFHFHFYHYALKIQAGRVLSQAKLLYISEPWQFITTVFLISTIRCCLSNTRSSHQFVDLSGYKEKYHEF